MVSTENDSASAPVELEVGTRVRTTVTSGDPGSTDTSAVSDEEGVIVQDFAENLDGTIGRDWARAQRWGIALDNGRLVFRSNDDVVAL